MKRRLRDLRWRYRERRADRALARMVRKRRKTPESELEPIEVFLARMVVRTYDLRGWPAAAQLLESLRLDVADSERLLAAIDAEAASRPDIRVERFGQYLSRYWDVRSEEEP